MQERKCLTVRKRCVCVHARVKKIREEIEGER